MTRRAPLSAGSRRYRGAMWLMALAAAFGAAAAAAGASGHLPPLAAAAGAMAFAGGLMGVVRFGMAMRRQALEDRDAAARAAGLVLLAATLKDRDDATLERLSAGGGPAGEAAALLLERRRGG